MKKKILLCFVLLISTLLFLSPCFAADGDNKSVLLFKSKNEVMVAKDGRINPLSLGEESIDNVYEVGERILVKTTNSVTGVSSLWEFRQGRLDLLIENFELGEIIEVKGNLVITGINRTAKINNIYLLRGESLEQLVHGAVLGKYLITDKDILMNVQDRYRNTSILHVDISSWEVRKVENFNNYTFIFSEGKEVGGRIFLVGSYSKGNYRVLVEYLREENNLRLISEDVKVELDNLIIFDNEIFYVNDKKLIRILEEKSYVKGKEFPITNIEVTVDKKDKPRFLTKDEREKEIETFDVDRIFIINDRLFITVNGANGKIVSSSKGTRRAINRDKGLYELTKEKSNYSARMDKFYYDTVRSDFSISSLFNTKKYVIALGKDEKEGDSCLAVRYKDREGWYYFPDISKVLDLVETNGELILVVEEFDRLNGKKQTSLVKVSGGVMTRIAQDIKVTNMITQAGGIVIELNDNVSKHKNLNTYFSWVGLEPIEGMLNSTYWKEFGNLLLVCAKTPNNSYDFYAIKNRQPTLLCADLEVMAVAEISDGVYAVSARDRNKYSPLRNKQSIYLYVEETGLLTVWEPDLRANEMYSAL